MGSQAQNAPKPAVWGTCLLADKGRQEQCINSRLREMNVNRGFPVFRTVSQSITVHKNLIHAKENDLSNQEQHTKGFQEQIFEFYYN